jgi:hypothetical protein
MRANACARRPLTFLLVGAGLVLALCLALGLHGFSLPRWHRLIDGSAAPEVLLGRAREHRWDDYAVQLSYALAQVVHRPRFPVVNEHIGLGQNMLVPASLPVAHPSMLFRPTTWGYFLGGDLGLAWHWWTQVLGVLVAWTAVFHRLLGAPFGRALAGAGLILAAPFFQFWSFNMAAVTASGALCALGLAGLLLARRPGAILASGVLLGWAGGVFGLSIYPPYLVSLGVLVVLLVVGVLVERRAELHLRAGLAWRAVGLAVALGLVALAAGTLLSGASDAITALRDTAYPGRRVATGGDRPLWWLLNATLAAPAQIGEEGWGALLNPCEAASYWLVSPALAGLVLLRWLRSGQRPRPLVALLLAYCLVGLLYCHFGVSESLARATLLAHVPGKRAVLGLALAEALLVVAVISERSRTRRADHAVLALAWTGALLLAAWRLRDAVPELEPAALCAAAVLNGLALFALAQGWRPTRVLGAVVSALLLGSVWFNPLVRGGSAYVSANPLARAACELDRAAGGTSVWATYGHSAMGALLVANGLHVVTCEQAIPQLELWARLDPRGEHAHEYNRYANVMMKWPPPGGTPGIQLTDEANILLYLDPQGRDLAKLGVTHLLATLVEGTRQAEHFAAFEPAARVGHHALFRLPLVARGR